MRYVAAVTDIDEGEAVDEEVVAHVQDVCFGEVKDCVGVGVSGLVVFELNVFAVKVDGGLIVVGDNGEAVAEFRVAEIFSLGHSHAHICVPDYGSILCERLVSAGMVTMEVCIHEEGDVAFLKFADGLSDGLGHIGVVGIDDEYAVFADGYADVSAASLEHVYGVGKFLCFNILGVCGCGDDDEGECYYCVAEHWVSPYLVSSLKLSQFGWRGASDNELKETGVWLRQSCKRLEE